MTVKNAVDKTWAIQPSTDNRLYSGYQLGNAPGTYPVIYYTDIIDGPTSGGENNKGCYLSVYGKGFGKFSDWGVNNHLYIGGVEVDNYRCLTPCVGTGLPGPGNGVFETWGLMRLTVQVGALGSPTAGTALNITMSVRGQTLGNPTSAGQFLDLAWGQPLTFTPTQGTIVFVDPVNGNDANAGTFAAPFKNVQGSGGQTGALRQATAATGAGATAGTPAGQHTVIRNGTLAPVGNWTTPTLNYGCVANLFRISGTPPAAGLKRGNLVITSYPGAAGANSPEVVTYNPGNGNHAAAGFYGNDQARSSGSATETNPYDSQPGWGRDIVVSNLSLIPPPDGPRDGGPINLNSSGDRWRIINNELSWMSTGTGTNGAKAAAVAGNGYGVLMAGNYCHDISNGDGQNQNHGVYIDGSAVCANNFWVAFNIFKNCIGGNGIQTYNSQASDFIQNVYAHHNWVETVNKHGLNCSDNTRSRTDWNNIVLYSGESSINISTGAIAVANGYKAFNNTLVGWGRVVSARSAIWDQGGNGTAPASTDIRNNIIYQLPGYPTSNGFTSLDGTGTNNLSYNIWFDANGVMTTRPSLDTTGMVADPQFNLLSKKDFSLKPTSPAINAGTTTLYTRTTDFFGNLVSGTPDIGAIEYGAHP